MVELVNGRGQLGEKLQPLKNLEIKEKVFIYHTWKVPHLYDPKGSEEEIQRKEYEKFVQFIDKVKDDEKIIFISTNSKRGTYYTHYKELAESYLLYHHLNSYVLKFPLFVGKGVMKKIKDGEMDPYGIMEIITLDGVFEEVKNCIFRTGMKRIFTIEGEKISAETVAEILKV
jgi:hypothetical protein